jgi:hypothetical protein
MCVQWRAVSTRKRRASARGFHTHVRDRSQQTPPWVTQQLRVVAEG